MFRSRFLSVLCVALLSVALALPARAVTLIRDADIEHGLAEIARPILTAAGLSPARIRILVIEDRSLNAFVASNDAIFLHTGLILELESAAQLQAVIAHEAAHIANGHLSRRLGNFGNARTAAGLGILLAAAAAMAGGGDAAFGLAVGTQSAAQRNLFAHTRAEEASADQAGARYMIAAGVPITAAVEVLEIFRGQEALTVGRQDPYVLTHPLSADRIRALEALAAANPVAPGNTATADYWFDRVQGKISAFLRDPSWTLRQVRGQNSDVAVLRRAVAHHLSPDPAAAIASMDALVAARPNDPFLHDLRGQILLENGRVQAAVSAYGRAVDLAPRNALILAGYGRALLALDTADGNRRALEALEASAGRDGQNQRMLRDLALAYARAGQNGMASLVTAERYALSGNFNDMGIHARRAEGLLPTGTSAWRRAQEMVQLADG